MIAARYLIWSVLAVSTAFVLLGILLNSEWHLDEAKAPEQGMKQANEAHARLPLKLTKTKVPDIGRAKGDDSWKDNNFQASYILLSDGRKGFIGQETGKLELWDMWTPAQKNTLGLDQDMQKEIYESYDNAALENLSEHGDYLAMWHLGRRIAHKNPLRAEKLWLDAVAVFGKAGPIITDASAFAEQSRDFDAYMKYQYLALNLGFADALVREKFMINELGLERANAAKQQANELLDYIRKRRLELTGKELVLPEPVIYFEPVEIKSLGGTE